MHIFLQGIKGVGKSTVIRKTLDIITSRTPLLLGGFFTWKGRKDDLNLYIHSARRGNESDLFCVAMAGEGKGKYKCGIQVFEREGVRLLDQSRDADLIIMDELGYMESNAPGFRQAVLNIINGSIPVFGVLRLGDVPWHDEIKRNPHVTIYDVNEENRDNLPRELADILQSAIRNL